MEILCKSPGHKPVPHKLLRERQNQKGHLRARLSDPFSVLRLNRDTPLNISKHEQRVLHELALGGAIHHERRENGKIHAITCFTRDGHVLSDCTLDVFLRLRKRRLIRSHNGKPYRVSQRGIHAVRAQLDQR